MKNLLKPHQTLLVILLILLVVQGIVYFLLISPQQARLQEYTEDIKELRSSMSKGKWPMDAAVLDKHLAELNKEAGIGGGSRKDEKRLDRLARARSLMGSTFEARIREKFPEATTVEIFMTSGTRFAYREEYERVVKDLEAKKIYLSPERLGMGPDAHGKWYQMLMRIWTVEKLCLLAVENELVVCLEKANPGNPQNRGHQVKPVSHVVSYTPRAYFELPTSDYPYLIDFPVEIEVEGSVEACMDYLHALEAKPVCLPPIHYELFSQPPAQVQGDEDGWLKQGRIRMRLVCCSYLAPDFTSEK